MVGADITEADTEVGVVVEVGEREDVIVVKWGCRWNDESGFYDFNVHFWSLSLVVGWMVLWILHSFVVHCGGL